MKGKTKVAKKVISYGMPKEKIHPAALAGGHCPHCGRIDLWLNEHVSAKRRT